MKIVLDTCSILALGRYYLPFDNKLILFNFLKEKTLDGTLVIIDKVLTECQYQARKIETLSFLYDKEFLKKLHLPYKTDRLIAPAPKKFNNQVRYQFVADGMRKTVNDDEFEVQKNEYMEDADIKQIIYCLILKEQQKKVILVTEETDSNNDGKLFKKIPSICRMLDVETMPLPKLLIDLKMDVEFKPHIDESPICERCRHYWPLLRTCNAFPDGTGIPQSIISSNRHDEPIDGQNNEYVFTPMKN
jgi:hypothetical protein